MDPLKVTNMGTRHFIIEGRPQAKERPRMAYGKAFTPPKTKEYEAKTKQCYNDVYGDLPQYEGLVAVDVFVFFNKNNHGDIDNYVKIALDGLNGVAWKDDKAVRFVRGFMVVDKAERMRMEITIRHLPENYQNDVRTLIENVTKPQ